MCERTNEENMHFPENALLEFIKAVKSFIGKYLYIRELIEIAFRFSFSFSEYPEKRPMLFTEQNRYEPGDVLRANCSTLPSRPKAELKFTINNIVVSVFSFQIGQF